MQLSSSCSSNQVGRRRKRNIVHHSILPPTPLFVEWFFFVEWLRFSYLLMLWLLFSYLLLLYICHMFLPICHPKKAKKQTS